MAAELPTLQQQLAEVQEAARDEGRPVLVQAAWMGRHDLLALLLRPCPPAKAHSHGRAPSPSSRLRSAPAPGVIAAFVAAANRGHPQCMRVLLDASPAFAAHLVRFTSPKGGTLLMAVVSAGHASCVELVLRMHDPDVQVMAADIIGRRAIHYACLKGHTDCAAVLLRHSPDAQIAASAQGRPSPLVYAAAYGQLACAQLLLEHSPQLQQLDCALIEAACGLGGSLQLPDGGGTVHHVHRQHERCIELLLSKGAMLTAGTPDAILARVRPVIRDLAARALAPDMANTASSCWGLALALEARFSTAVMQAVHTMRCCDPALAVMQQPRSAAEGAGVGPAQQLQRLHSAAFALAGSSGRPSARRVSTCCESGDSPVLSAASGGASEA